MFAPMPALPALPRRAPQRFRTVAPTAAALALSAYALLAAAPQAARAQATMTLFSNLDATPSSSDGTPIDANGAQKAVAFTTGATAYSLSSVQAYLSLRNSTDTSSLLSFGLYTPSVAGGSDPGTLAVSLGTQTVTSAANAPAQYTFTPSSGFVMSANTRYVLLCDYVSGNNDFWYSANPQVAPTARNNSGYNTPTYRSSGSNGTTYATSTLFNLFAVNGAVVPTNTPEPATLPLLGMGLVSGAGFVGTVRRRRLRSAAKPTAA